MESGDSRGGEGQIQSVSSRSAMDSCGSSRRSSASTPPSSSPSAANDDDWFDEVDTCGLEDEQVRIKIYVTIITDTVITNDTMTMDAMNTMIDQVTKTIGNNSYVFHSVTHSLTR